MAVLRWLRDRWTVLAMPWSSARNRDEFDVDILNALHRLDVRLRALEERAARDAP